MEELRTYWEVPAVAHFCSLFRAVFKLIDFDIEDFEEALIVDTESAVEGGRSSLIVDVLTALLRGCLGRRDITLLNYNGFLHDLLSIRWVRTGLGQNPLGEDRERACFHILPLYAKVKILHCLCEWRLERPDVEMLTRDLSGDSLRVVPLGQDQKGSTYWYFYGTRLYREDVVVPPKSAKKRQRNESPVNDLTLRSVSSNRGRKKRRRRNYDFGTKKHKTSPKKRTRSPSVESTSKSESKPEKMDDTSPVGDGASNVGTPMSKNPEMNGSAYELDEPEELVNKRWKPKLEPDLPMENASGSSSFPATPLSVQSNTAVSTGVPPSVQQEDSSGFNDMIKRIYSRDEDDEDEGKSENSGSTTRSKQMDQPSAKLEEGGVVDGETVKSEEPSTSGISLKRPYIPVGPPPWDQPELCASPAELRGWSLVCSTLDDWKLLAESFSKPKGKAEVDLREILRRDFLPAMQDLYDQKQKERFAKLAELSPRRASDRLEVKRLQKEREEKILSEREKEERDRLAKIDEERQRRLEQEKREQRVRLRELEKEKRQLIKQRATEERSRRLELRQRRQQLIAEGKDIPEDLLNAMAGTSFMNDQELNEIDIEIELEHMYGQLEKLLDQLKESEDAEPFLDPVKEDIAPDYYKVVEKPMDFSKIEDKLLYREYKNKAEFVEDFNLILLNCLHYNGLQSEYTKIAQRMERAFIKAWRKFFPPSDLDDSGEQAREDELHCISLLGALDIKIKNELARVEEEEKAKTMDKKEIARLRKREADRRRRRLLAESKRIQNTSDQSKLASQSLSSLTSQLDDTTKRQLPAPFLVGRTNNYQKPMSSRIPDGKFLPARAAGSSTASLSSGDGNSSGGGLRTLMPGISTIPHPPRPLFRGPLNSSRLLPARPPTSRLIPAIVNRPVGPITVQTSTPTTKVINVSDGGMLKNSTTTSTFPPYASRVRMEHRPKLDGVNEIREGVRGIRTLMPTIRPGGSPAPVQPSNSILLPPSSSQPNTILLSPSSTQSNPIILNSGGARLVRLIPQQQQQVQQQQQPQTLDQRGVVYRLCILKNT